MTAVCVSLQGPAGLKGGEGLPGVAGAIVSLILLNCFLTHPLLSAQLLLYRMLGHMKQEAVSMVITDRDHHIKSESESCDTLTLPLYLLLFPGCRRREGPRWGGRRYRPARTARRRGPRWADGRERRACKM